MLRVRDFLPFLYNTFFIHFPELLCLSINHDRFNFSTFSATCWNIILGWNSKSPFISYDFAAEVPLSRGYLNSRALNLLLHLHIDWAGEWGSFLCNLQEDGSTKVTQTKRNISLHGNGKPQDISLLPHRYGNKLNILFISNVTTS